MISTFFENISFLALVCIELKNKHCSRALGAFLGAVLSIKNIERVFSHHVQYT